MSKERLINYIIYIITDTMIDAWEQNLTTMHDNLLLLRKEPTNLYYIYNWVKANQSYVINASRTVNNNELHRLVVDGMRLAYAHYYNNDKMINTKMTTGEYAAQCKAEYSTEMETRKNGH